MTGCVLRGLLAFGVRTLGSCEGNARSLGKSPPDREDGWLQVVCISIYFLRGYLLY